MIQYRNKSRPKRRKKWRDKGYDFSPRSPKPVKKPKPRKYLEKVLVIPKLHSKAFFTRKNGSWRCTTASPQIEWFTRVRHMDKIQEWLRNNFLSYHWVNPKSSCAVQQKQDDYRPAEAYPANKPSVSSENNTPLSLNKKVTETSNSVTPEQTGVSIPCCLIPTQPAQITAP